MIPARTFNGQKVAVFGLGISGIATARSLRLGGADVAVWDDQEKARSNAQSDRLVLEDLYSADWSHFDALILSPGVPLTHPEPHKIVTLAREADVPIIGDVEIFARELAAIEAQEERPKVIAITGTNGKSTTTALIAHVLNHFGLTAHAGGNLGEPILNLPAPKRGAIYVIEMSSYQIDLTPSLTPDVAVLLNITEDHLDRHGGMEGYAAVKEKIFQNLRENDVAVIGVDDTHTQKICTRISAQQGIEVKPISVGKALGRGVYAINGVLYDGVVRPCLEVADLRQAIALPGAHNWQNAAAAYAATCGFVSDVNALAKGILSFPGLPHRLESLGAIDSVRFVNDSKATNTKAAAQALDAFEDIYWIAGGIAKEGGIKSLKPYLSHITKAYLIGEAAGDFADTLGDKVPHHLSGDLASAVALAFKEAKASKSKAPVILLSPACASFDQFKNFEDRGNAFREIVSALKKTMATGGTGKESAA